MKVLLIRLSSLGDAVLATSAVETLHAARPDAVIDVLTKPAFREVFEGNPAVRRVFTWEKGEGPRAVAGKLLPEDYGLVADLHANLRTRLLRLFLPVRWSVYRKGALRRRLAVRLGRPGLLDDIHVADRYLAALLPVAPGAERKPPRLYPGDAARKSVRALLAGAGWDGAAPAVALAPGARWATKAWPPAKWAELAGLIAARGWFPVLTGGPGEAPLAEEILARAGSRGLAAAGRTDLRETAALLEACTALVTNDSAPLHIASAVGTPVVALFGPTVRGFGFFPLGARDRVLETDLPCRPCSLHGGDRCPEGHFRCMEGIAAKDVMGALEELVSR